MNAGQAFITRWIAIKMKPPESIYKSAVGKGMPTGEDKFYEAFIVSLRANINLLLFFYIIG